MEKLKQILLLLAAGWLYGTLSPALADPAGKELTSMTFVPETFARVSLGTFDQSPCSPQAPSAEWSGVIIAAPRRIIVPAGQPPVIPVCGYYLLPAGDAMAGPPLTVHITSVATGDRMSAPVTAGQPDEPEIPPPAEAPVHDPADLADVETGGYFNIDARRCLDRPLAPGRYDITLTYAGATSNRVFLSIETAP